MFFFKKILHLVYSQYLLSLYENDKNRVNYILENFFESLTRFNTSLKMYVSSSLSF